MKWNFRFGIIFLLLLALGWSAHGTNVSASPSAGSYSDSRAGHSASIGIKHDPNTLVIGSQYGDPQNLDPIATFLLSWGMIGNNVFDGLTFRGPDLKIHKNLGLATNWHYLKPTVLRMNLRHGVKFQDGEPFNANAVKFTFDRLLGPLGQKGPQYFQYKTIKTVKVVNPYTVDFIMKQPDPVLITKLAGYGAMIVPPKYIRQHGNKYFATHPIGTGAYRVTRYVRGAEVDLTRNDHWWGGKARMKNIIFRFEPEDATRLADLQTGHIDIMQKVATGQISTVKGSSGLKLYPVPSTTVEGLFLNGRSGPMKNQKVRQAVEYAIDKTSIIKDILNGYGRTVSSWQSRLSFGYDPGLAPYPYNPNKAKALLAASHVKSPHVTFQIDGTDTIFKQVAEVIVAELQQVGFSVTLKTVDPTVLYNTNIPKGKYGDIAEFVWGGWTMDFDNTAYSLYHCGEFYNPGYCNGTMNKLLQAERTTLNTSKRLKVFKQMDVLLHKQVPTVALFQTVNVWAASTHVHNFVAPPDDRLELQHVYLK